MTWYFTINTTQIAPLIITKVYKQLQKYEYNLKHARI